ncbi:MAG TPA: LLM class flavin-dependent oxidoreductase [Phenylobacterium sp.]|uniref:LLM class flavin-dependent oxidoreductase n=1 Tax=Phenylobacterium sp. TaxID=1871053 RepID=UPI002D400268|nr:LLM class flavin-dependent oxidoreductase [Phenylobacterium sp.]HZZ68275.1 LLM class flavin-dependent oxidoreductase [Phenylobacterium sp.]
MRFGIFYEHQLPRPWTPGLEQKLFQDALSQVELADKLGFDNVWEVEHHFLEEYSHSSAPEVFLAACSQRTKQIRLGHGIVLMPPGYNHPARVAERIATLDLVSNGRVEFGTGESSAWAELGGYGVPVESKRPAWREAVEQCANILAMDPYPGFEGQYFSMPARNAVPKPVQKPHPPLWVACSNRETIKLAARLGIGALTFAFVDPAEATQWVEDYYRIFKEECVPIGHAVNPNICMVSSFGIHQDAEEARRRFQEGFRFFQFALGWHYGFGEQVPGRTSIWDLFQKAQGAMAAGAPGAGGIAGAAEGGIGNPDQVREHIRKFEACGVDQVAFIQQAGRNQHDHICEALSLFATDVMGEFKQREAARVAKKAEALAPYVEAAFKRKEWMKPLADDEIPTVVALGRQVAETGGGPPPANPAQAQRAARNVAWREALEKAGE